MDSRNHGRTPSGEVPHSSGRGVIEKTEIPYSGAHCIGFPIHAHASSCTLCQTTCHSNALSPFTRAATHPSHTHTSTDELIDMQLRIRRTGPAFMPHRTGAFSLKHTNYPEEDTCGRLYTSKRTHPPRTYIKNHDTHSRTPRTATHPALRRRTFLA